VIQTRTAPEGAVFLLFDSFASIEVATGVLTGAAIMGTPCSACNKRVIAGRLTLGGTGLVFHRIKKGKNRGKWKSAQQCCSK
jgi:hypothetical protein